jgi:hypothetical protein
MTPMFTTEQLAERWQISARTLVQWRWQGIGPKYVKLNGERSSVRYRLQDIEEFEAASLTTPEPGPGVEVDNG